MLHSVPLRRTRFTLSNLLSANAFRRFFFADDGVRLIQVILLRTRKLFGIVRVELGRSRSGRSRVDGAEWTEELRGLRLHVENIRPGAMLVIVHGVHENRLS